MHTYHVSASPACEHPGMRYHAGRKSYVTKLSQHQSAADNILPSRTSLDTRQRTSYSGHTGLSLPFGPRAGSLLPLKTSPLLTEIGCPVNCKWTSQEALETALMLGQECFCNRFSTICPSREPCGVIAASCSGFAISICFSHVIWWSIHSIFCKRRRSQLQEWKNEPKNCARTITGGNSTVNYSGGQDSLYVAFFQTTKNSLYKLSPEYPDTLRWRGFNSCSIFSLQKLK